MPRVVRTAKRRLERWTREERDYLGASMAFGPRDDPFVDDAEAAACWEDVRVETLERFALRFPGLRPRGWWEHDAPKNTDGVHMVGRGASRRAEPEIVFLHRHGLLWAREIEAYWHRGGHRVETDMPYLPAELRPPKR